MTHKRLSMFLIELTVVAVLAAAALIAMWTIQSRRDMDPRADKYSEGQCP